jgi:ribosomal protein S13
MRSGNSLKAVSVFKIEENYVLKFSLNIKRLMDIGYRGIRHRTGLPLRDKN